MYTYRTIQVHEAALENGDATGTKVEIRLSREGTTGTLGHAMIGELTDALTRLGNEQRARLLVLRGSPDLFCPPVDWESLEDGDEFPVQLFRRLEKALTLLEKLPVASIALIEGSCVDAGLDLALACDVRLGTTESRCGITQIRHGRLPSMLPFRLPKYTGAGTAKWMFLTGVRLNAADAASVGLLDRVSRTPELDISLSALTQALLSADRTALLMARRLTLEAFATPAEEAIGNFLAAQDRCLSDSRRTQS